MRIVIELNTRRYINQIKDRLIPYHKFPSEFRCSCGTVNSPGVFGCSRCGATNVNLIDQSHIRHGGLSLEELINIWGDKTAKEWKKMDNVIKKARREERRLKRERGGI